MTNLIDPVLPDHSATHQHLEVNFLKALHDQTCLGKILAGLSSGIPNGHTEGSCGHGRGDADR